MVRITKQPTIWLTVALLAVACGGLSPSSRRSGGGSSADALPTLGGGLADLDTPEVKACHASGFVFDRLQLACSTEIKLAKSYTCDRDGIAAAFAATGYQIGEVLDQALGREADPKDGGDGYTIDQCGESDTGRLIAYLVKKDAAGKVQVREIETDK
jgi:hypothetical protein